MPPKKKDDATIKLQRRYWSARASNGDLYGPAMNIQTEEEATSYMVALTHWSARHWGGDYKALWDRHLSNIGYFAGYFDEATRARVEKVFKAKHPIFGSANLPVTEAGIAFAYGGVEAAREVMAEERKKESHGR
jgi:hypothetical protein